METEEIMELEKEHIMQSYSRFKIVVDYGNGCYVYDKEGKKYLDMIGGLATASLGYGDKALAKVLKKQAENLINVTNLFYTELQVKLAEKLSKISGLQKSFFSNSGSEANEIAIKLARKFTGRPGIIATEGAFHGRTFGALTATWKKSYKEDFEPLVPKFKHIPYNDIQALHDAIDEETAAFIVEPIQGESGIIIPDKGYLKEAHKICKDAGVLLIVDEIQTSLRTGKFFAYQHEGIKPDIVTVAKGIAGGVPIGITIASKDVADAFKPGDQGSTFGGNALSCVAALFVIDYVQKNNLVEYAGNLGAYFIGKLHEMKTKKSTIKDVRGKGLMIAVELTVKAQDIVNKCLEKGLLVNKCTDNTIRFLPPLIITKKEIYKALKILDEVIC